MYLKYLYKFETLAPSKYSPCDWMQWSKRRSHCWKHCLKPSMEMLSRTASDSRWTSATSVKCLAFKSRFIPGNKRKSQAARWDEWGGEWETTTILFCSQKGGVLLMLQMFNENRWQPFTAFLLKVLGDVSSSGNSTGIAASSHGGSASKGSTASNLYKHITRVDQI